MSAPLVPERYGLALPAALRELIERGVWPRTLAQQRERRLYGDRPRRIDPTESSLELCAPPFKTISDTPAHEDYWAKYGAPAELDFSRALVIASFMVDTVLVLDYAVDAKNPPVKYLDHSPARGCFWRVVAQDVAALLALLELDVVRAAQPGCTRP